jgi:uncharacterized protein YggT (Ycf19 family)
VTPVAVAAAPVAAAAVARPAAPARRARTWPGALSRILTFLFGVLQALLLLRIVLLLLAANQDNSIVAGILSVTDPFVEPFRGMFKLDEIKSQHGSILDLAAIVALVAWSLVETLLVSILRLLGRKPR